MKNYICSKIKVIVLGITLAKFISAFLTIVFVSGIKFAISGGFQLQYSYFFSNVVAGLLGWTVNISLISIFTDLLNLNGINFNLEQLLFGFHTIENSNLKVDKFEVKRYNAMESSDGGNSGQSSDKGKGIEPPQHPSHGPELGRPLLFTYAREPHLSLFRKVFPGLDPTTLANSNRINPGPGFNVPGWDVPLTDEICKHLDYNVHILRQYRTMDLEVAIIQKNNALALIRVLEGKYSFAQNALTKIPAIPTTEHEFKLKDQILEDLKNLHSNKIRTEAKVILLNSRIEFIEISIKKN